MLSRLKEVRRGSSKAVSLEGANGLEEVVESLMEAEFLAEAERGPRKAEWALQELNGTVCASLV